MSDLLLGPSFHFMSKNGFLHFFLMLISIFD